MIENLNFNEIFFLFSVMAVTAIPVGFFAGLFGIGGGLITVPVLFYIFGNLNFNSEYLMHLAVGTSFAIIVPTSISSVITHNKFKAVDFNIVKTYGLFVVIGVILGTFFAASLKTQQLLLFFSFVTLILGFYLIFSKYKEKDIKSTLKLYHKVFFGLISGFISAPMGIGGAVMNVPILKFFGYNINRAIGSSAAIGFLISITGSVGFLIFGNFKEINSPLSVGFIHIPAFFIFVPITILMARVGARTVHKIDKKIITKLFGVLNLIVSTSLLIEYFNY